MNSFHPTFTITNRITSGLTVIERARGFLEAATLSEAWLREMGHRTLILEAHHTTHIEGTRLTLEQAERLLDGETGSRVRPRRRVGTFELQEGVRIRLRLPRGRRPDHRGAGPGNPKAAGRIP